MKAVILAAGVGSRLRPITDEKPKTMVEVNGVPMLGHIIGALEGAGIKRIVICTGYRAEAIETYCRSRYPGLQISYVPNLDYDTTNNMYSLYLARDELDDDLILMNADLVFDPEVMRHLVAAQGTRVAVDKGTYNEESMKITIREDGTISGISKKIGPGESYGSSIDIYRIERRDAAALYEGLVEFVEGKEDRKQWTEVLLHGLFASKKVAARPLEINPCRWFEIDNYEDLSKAEILFNQRLGDLSRRTAFFIDRDGTIALEDGALPGANEALEALRAKGKMVFLLTNNSSRTPDQHLAYVRSLGIDLAPEEVLVSTSSCLEALKALGYRRLYWVANEAVSEWIHKAGFVLDEESPEAVVLTYDDEVTYDKLVVLCRLVRAGLPYFATHIDLVCPSPDGPVPDIGCLIDVVRQTTGRGPDRTFGKPSTSLIAPILEARHLGFQDCVIVGDRLYTDIRMAEGNEMLSVLVLTGETDRSLYEKSPIKADIVLPSIKDLHTNIQR